MMRRPHVILAVIGLITVVALTIALGMLAHATGSGPHQWADGAAAGVGMALVLLIIVGGGVWFDTELKRRARYTVPAERMIRSRTGRTRATDPGPVADERIGPDTEQRLRADADHWLADAPPADPPALVRPRHAATLRLEDLAEGRVAEAQSTAGAAR